MKHWLKRLILIPCACFVVGCSSSSDKPAKVARQEAPPPAATAAPQKKAAVQPSAAPASAAAQTATSAPGQPRTGPAIDVPENSYNFGSLDSDKDYIHEFIVRNVGTEEVQIKKVLPG